MLSNILFVFWAMEFQEKSLLRFTDLYWDQISPILTPSKKTQVRKFLRSWSKTSALNLYLRPSSTVSVFLVWSLGNVTLSWTTDTWFLEFWKPARPHVTTYSQFITCFHESWIFSCYFTVFLNGFSLQNHNRLSNANISRVFLLHQMCIVNYYVKNAVKNSQ